ncbi:MAG: NAD(+) diphosphatase [Treponema sp.]|nr:NAD(+) diphosphatase [Treponema sp.]
MAISVKNFSIYNKKIYIFLDKEVLVKKAEQTVSRELPKDDIYTLLENKNAFCLSFYDSCTDAVGALLQDDFDKNAIASDYEFIPLRQYFFETNEEEAALSARIKSYASWLTNTKFCCKCGSPLELYQTENALYCPKCRTVHYPRIEPCIIVLVHKDDKVLLLKHTYRNQDRFVCLAGFIEVGESVEQCVHREVKEEVGIEITNLRYRGSQGWPFPDQLMLAFHADYAGGEIKLQESEIAEAKWLNPKDLDNPPLPGSVAWKLISGIF